MIWLESNRCRPSYGYAPSGRELQRVILRLIKLEAGQGPSGHGGRLGNVVLRGGAAVARLAHRQSAPSSSISQPSFADSGATAARSPRVAEIGVHRHARRGLKTIRLAGPPEDRVGERAEPGPHYSGCGRIGAETLAAPLPANVARASTTDADRAPSRNFLRRVSGLANCDRSENRGFSTQYVDCSRPERANNGGSKQRGGRSN